MTEGSTTGQRLVLGWGAGKDAPFVARLKQAGYLGSRQFG